jgi:hypothetical protein
MAFFKIPVTTTTPGIDETPDFSTRPGVSGFEQTITGANTFTLAPGCIRATASGGPFNINYGVYNGVTANLPGVYTVNTASVWTVTSSVGGAFPFAINTLSLSSHNTVFPLYAIWDSSNGTSPVTLLNQSGSVTNNFAVIIPTSANFLPTGYDSFACVGFVYINGTTFNIIPWLQTGHYEQRNYQLATAVQVLTAGAAGVPTLVDLTALNGPIPPKWATQVKLSALFTPAAAADQASLIATGLTSATPYPFVIQNSAALGAQSEIVMAPGIDPITGDAAIDYLVSGVDTLSLWVSEFSVDLMGPLR